MLISRGENVNAMKRSTVDILHATRKVCLEVNTKKSEYMLISHDYNAWHNHSIVILSNAFRGVAEFKYFGIMVVNQNHIYGEIRNRLNVGYFFCCLVQNPVFPFAVQTTKIKMCRIIILPIVSYIRR
jgi:hypothetical protein